MLLFQFPLTFQQNKISHFEFVEFAPFHHKAYDYSQAD